VGVCFNISRSGRCVAPSKICQIAPHATNYCFEKIKGRAWAVILYCYFARLGGKNGGVALPAGCTVFNLGVSLVTSPYFFFYFLCTLLPAASPSPRYSASPTGFVRSRSLPALASARRGGVRVLPPRAPPAQQRVRCGQIAHLFNTPLTVAERICLDMYCKFARVVLTTTLQAGNDKFGD